MHHVLIYAALFAACSAYALFRGGAPERVAALMFVVANVLSIVGQRPAGIAWMTVELNILLVDATLYVSLGALAVWADRYWPIWMASLQGITVLMHIAAAASPAFIAPAYYSAVAATGYPMAVILAAGAWRHRQRIRAFGADTAWRAI